MNRLLDMQRFHPSIKQRCFMYLEHWELQKTPFGNVPTRNIFYRSPQHEEALRRLLYVIEHRKGVAMLTGEVGCGKTTVMKALSDYLDKDKYHLQTLSNPALQPIDLIKAIVLKLGGHSQKTAPRRFCWISCTSCLTRMQKTASAPFWPLMKPMSSAIRLHWMNCGCCSTFKLMTNF